MYLKAKALPAVPGGVGGGMRQWRPHAHGMVATVHPRVPVGEGPDIHVHDPELPLLRTSWTLTHVDGEHREDTVLVRRGRQKLTRREYRTRPGAQRGAGPGRTEGNAEGRAFGRKHVFQCPLCYSLVELGEAIKVANGVVQVSDGD